MIIEKNTFEKMINSYSKSPPESGGIIGAKNGIVCEYIHDYSVQPNNRNVYIPNVEYLNSCIKTWAKKDIEFIGMIHSHAKNQHRLSNSDIEYISRILSLSNNRKLYFPIILPQDSIFIYIVYGVNEKIFIKSEVIEVV